MARAAQSDGGNGRAGLESLRNRPESVRRADEPVFVAEAVKKDLLLGGPARSGRSIGEDSVLVVGLRSGAKHRESERRAQESEGRGGCARRVARTRRGRGGRKARQER